MALALRAVLVCVIVEAGVVAMALYRETQVEGKTIRDALPVAYLAAAVVAVLILAPAIFIEWSSRRAERVTTRSTDQDGHYPAGDTPESPPN